MDILRPFLSRIIASLLSGLVMWLAAKGIQLDEHGIQTLTEAGVLLAITGFQLLYAILHRVIDKKVNPGDAASSHIAAVEKAESQQLKSTTNYTV